jgi:hypothetical protein
MIYNSNLGNYCSNLSIYGINQINIVNNFRYILYYISMYII